MAVVGEPPYAEGPATRHGGAAGRPGPALDALEATGKPVVVVVIAGRPLIMNQQLDGAAAALMAYLPGTEGGRGDGGRAVRRVNPSGRLSVSWPESIDQAPLTHDRLQGEDYDPRYAFGHGLSYTRVDYGGLDSSTSGDNVRVSLTVRNRGRRAGEHTALLFASKRGASEAFPASRLVAYRKLRLQPGDRRTVSLSFPVDRLAVTAGGDKAVEPGRYELTAGERSTTVEVR